MPRPWTLLDFVLVVVGGLLGAGIAFVIGVIGATDEVALLLGLTGQYAGHLFVIWLLGRNRIGGDLGFTVEPGDLLYLPLGLLLQILLAVLFLPLSRLVLPEGGPAQEIGDIISGLTTMTGRVGAVAIAALVAPVTEELMFRGVLIKALGKARKPTVIVLSAMVFAAFHVVGLDTGSLLAAASIVIPQIFLIGVILAWVTLRNGRLGPAIFIHLGFNLLAALALLIPADLLDRVS